MKDMPAALLVALSKRDPALMHRVFERVVDNGRVLRTVFQMIRSGQLGRTCLSASLQRAFQRWLNEASVGTLLSASIGQQPSLRDVLRLARPTPQDNRRRALFGWLTDKEVSQWAPATAADLPEQVQALTAYRQAETATAQAEILRHLSVRWDLLADAARGPEVWKIMARQMGPQALRMNLNTLLRHEVFQDRALVEEMAQRLTDADAIRRSRQFPYQYFVAYLNAHQEVPQAIKAALQQAAEMACENVPMLPGPVLIWTILGARTYQMNTALCRGATDNGTSLKNSLHLRRIATGRLVHPQRRQHGKRVTTVADRFDEHHRCRCLHRGVD